MKIFFKTGLDTILSLEGDLPDGLFFGEQNAAIIIRRRAALTLIGILRFPLRVNLAR